MAKPKTIELPATISQAIYDHLKKAIIRGELKPGQRIQEKDIAALFHVSSTPVREAFFRLAAERFLTITARKEVLVQGTSDAQVMELYEVVRALDGHAMKKVVRELTGHDLEKFRLMTMKLGEYYEAGDHQRYLEQNLKIHDRLWQVCGNKYLYAALTQLMEKIAIYRKHCDFVPFADAGAMEKSYRDHQFIQEALERRDLDGLEKVIETHWGEEFIKPLESRAKEPDVETP
ncbi:MAG TPA: GntR family transcriptional regulator [Acidobacteriota bacterium]|nr:GntR family transcriptional regulator [Acidobacteriota bacterium]